MKVPFSKTRRAMHPWPMPPGGPHYSVCHFCDTLHKTASLPEGTAARCSCCGAVLYQNRPASLVRATAFSVTALILMVVVHSFPFLVMDAASIRTSLNLVSASNALIHQGSPILGLVLALFTIVTPITMAGGLIYVCGPLMFGRIAPGATCVAKWMNKTEPWNMIEVFLLGVLVSGKFVAIAQGTQFIMNGSNHAMDGLSTFPFAAFGFAAGASIDRNELWDRLEVAKS